MEPLLGSLDVVLDAYVLISACDESTVQAYGDQSLHSQDLYFRKSSSSANASSQGIGVYMDHLFAILLES